MPHKVKVCQEILDHFLEEYVLTAKEYKTEGKLCPHRHSWYVDKLESIMDVVEQAHDVLHIAMARAKHDKGHNPYNPHENEEEIEHPSHARGTY